MTDSNRYLQQEMARLQEDNRALREEVLSLREYIDGLQALMEAGRYPVTVYPVWLQIIVTFIIPIAVATTVPLQALRGELDLPRVLLFFVIGIAAFLVASRVWKAGLKRYSGASS